MDNLKSLAEAINKIKINEVPIPTSWIKNIIYKTKKGTQKPDLLAMHILLDVLKEYRDVTKMDSSIIENFKYGLLQKSYGEYSELLNFSKKQIRESFNTLESLNIVKLEFKNIKIKGGVLYNVMFVKPNPEKIKNITYELERKL